MKRLRLTRLIDAFVPFAVAATLAGAAFLLWPTQGAHAQSEEGFRSWVREFSVEARRQGFPQRLLDEAFRDIEYNARVIELDNFQPEFVRPIWEYIEARTDPETLSLGELALRQHRDLFDQVERDYGVQREYIVAIWRLESYYGRHLGSFNVIESLSTLAYAGQRRDFWRGELVNALRIVHRGHAPLSRLQGSWAGAMGHTQFIPSSYLSRAVDYDGDGTRDLWQSLPDVFASTANYLKEAGWAPGEPFGFEVRLPENFDFAGAAPDVRRSAAEWRARGVTMADGSPLRSFEGQGAVIVPAGHRGPAFLVLNNYRTILRYNNATAYALTVGILAERLNGASDIRGDWPRDARPLSRDQKEELQRLLIHLGFDPGPVDGKVGPSTRSAIRDYQRSRGVPPDGFASVALLDEMRQLAGRDGESN